MKLKPAMLPFAACLLLAGCDSNTPKDNLPTPEPPSPSAEAPAPPKPAAAAKDEFIAVMDKKLAELDARITEWTKKAEGYKDDAKVQADQTLAALNDQRGKLKGKLEELKKAGGDAWKEIKAGCDTALDELEKAFENAKAKFS